MPIPVRLGVLLPDRGRRLGAWASCSSRRCSELPRERTRLLDNLGRIRREVGPITPELSDALADHMSIRRGEVHEVVSFYSFLQLPIDVTRVCTGPVCDCFGAHRLLDENPGAVEVACLGHCDLAPVLTRGDEIVPAVTHATNDGPAVGLGRATTTLADYEARGGLELLRDLPAPSASSRSSRPRGSPGTAARASPPAQVGGRLAAADPRSVVVNADEGEPGTIKDRYVMELRPHLLVEGDADRDALRAGGCRLRLPARGVRDARERLEQAIDGVPRGRPARRAHARARRRRRRVHRRRGDGDARVDGGPPGDAAPAAARSRRRSATSGGRR